jgi:hypothetical protein
VCAPPIRCPVTDRLYRIDAPRIRSLCWIDDALIDWVGGGQVLHLDGTLEAPRVNYAFRFDSAVTSSCGEFAVIYEKLGTKALVLRQGEVIREIDRSFYHAHVYEYPIAIFRSPSGQVLIAHCPDQYCRLELEDIETGERIGNSGKRKPRDFFHSRLRVSPNGRWLLSGGWVWHPFSMVEVFDLEAAIGTADALDTPIGLPEIDGEVGAAEFLPNDQILIATSEESLNEEHAAIRSNEIAVIDVATRQVISRSLTEQRVGSLMPLDEDVAVGFLEHPKLFSLRTGAVLQRWETIKSGNQTSSIIWGGMSTPPIATDVAHRRFAVADESCVYVVQLPPGKPTPG